MSWIRKFSVLGLVVLLGLGVGCTSDGPSEPAASAAAQQPSYLLGDLGDLSLLTCSEQPYVVVQETIGPDGGKIKVGTHLLEIPKGALSKDVSITAEQISGSTNSLRFSPHQLKFNEPATLTMSYENCDLVSLPKKIVYTTEQLKILEVLLSTDLFQKKKVSAPIDHFSRYAVAY